MNPLAGVELRRSAHNLADVYSLMVRPSHAAKYRTLVAAPTNVAIDGLAARCLKQGGGTTLCMRKYGQKITVCQRGALEAISVKRQDGEELWASASEADALFGTVGSTSSRNNLPIRSVQDIILDDPYLTGVENCIPV